MKTKTWIRTWLKSWTKLQILIEIQSNLSIMTAQGKHKSGLCRQVPLVHVLMRNHFSRKANNVVSVDRWSLDCTMILNLLAFCEFKDYAIIRLLASSSIWSRNKIDAVCAEIDALSILASGTRFKKPFFNDKWQKSVTNLLITNQKQGFH